MLSVSHKCLLFLSICAGFLTVGTSQMYFGNSISIEEPIHRKITDNYFSKNTNFDSSEKDRNGHNDGDYNEDNDDIAKIREHDDNVFKSINLESNEKFDDGDEISSKEQSGESSPKRTQRHFWSSLIRNRRPFGVNKQDCVKCCEDDDNNYFVGNADYIYNRPILPVYWRGNGYIPYNPSSSPLPALHPAMKSLYPFGSFKASEPFRKPGLFSSPRTFGSQGKFGSSKPFGFSKSFGPATPFGPSTSFVPLTPIGPSTSFVPLTQFGPSTPFGPPTSFGPSIPHGSSAPFGYPASFGLSNNAYMPYWNSLPDSNGIQPNIMQVSFSDSGNGLDKPISNDQKQISQGPTSFASEDKTPPFASSKPPIPGSQSNPLQPVENPKQQNLSGVVLLPDKNNEPQILYQPIIYISPKFEANTRQEISVGSSEENEDESGENEPKQEPAVETENSDRPKPTQNQQQQNEHQQRNDCKQWLCVSGSQCNVPLLPHPPPSILPSPPSQPLLPVPSFSLPPPIPLAPPPPALPMPLSIPSLPTPPSHPPSPPQSIRPFPTPSIYSVPPSPPLGPFQTISPILPSHTYSSHPLPNHPQFLHDYLEYCRSLLPGFEHPVEPLRIPMAE